MKAVIQRVDSASVIADGIPAGAISKGLLILLGIKKGDSEDDAEVLAAKISKLRIFSDENDRMNLCVNDIEGGVLIVPNFTLYANYSHGNRPDFFTSEEPSRAEYLYNYFVLLMKKSVGKTGTGVFGASMSIDAKCDGPVTIVMDSEKLLGRKD